MFSCHFQALCNMTCIKVFIIVVDVAIAGCFGMMLSTHVINTQPHIHANIMPAIRWCCGSSQSPNHHCHAIYTITTFVCSTSNNNNSERQKQQKKTVFFLHQHVHVHATQFRVVIQSVIAVLYSIYTKHTHTHIHPYAYRLPYKFVYKIYMFRAGNIVLISWYFYTRK